MMRPCATSRFGGESDRDKVSVSTSWYLSRRIELTPTASSRAHFPGNQIITTIQFGDEAQGFYGGTRIGYDFTDRFISSEDVIEGRLRNSRSYVGYGWDCCGVQFNYNTFKAGLRNESAFSFTFTLAGLGSFGTDQFSQLGGGRGGRKRGKKAHRNNSTMISVEGASRSEYESFEYEGSKTENSEVESKTVGPRLRSGTLTGQYY